MKTLRWDGPTRFQFISIFGDGKPHSWMQVVYFGVQLFKVHQKEVERLFKKAVFDGLLYRVDTPEIVARRRDDFYTISYTEFDFVISDKGDACLRDEQINRHGDFSYYKYYDRSVHGSNGADRFAKVPKGLHKELGTDPALQRFQGGLL